MNLLTLILLLSLSAFAERKTIGPAISNTTVSGGSVLDPGNPNTVVCLTADMSQVQYGAAPNGVKMGAHNGRLSLHNISTITQTVRIEFRPGTFAEVAYSSPRPSPETLAIADTVDPLGFFKITPSAGSKFYDVGVIGPNGSHDVPISVNCSYNRCSLFVAGQYFYGFDQVNPNVCQGFGEKACIKVTSTLYLAIHVLEDKGAMTADYTTEYHRCNGWKDKWLSTPARVSFNGGRPF